MATKNYETMSDDDLTKERIRLDKQMQELRSEKKKIQDEVDRRLQAASENGTHNISGAGGIESQEKVGKNG